MRPTLDEIRKFVALNARLHTSAKFGLSAVISNPPLAKKTVREIDSWLTRLEKNRADLAKWERRHA